ncbi:CBS domain-containing protein [Klenkia sp. LSe6-5]|uniref:CBS domain-containing protein n=1 Tax=Klenkia sesuvii TaxID=3103137 RepID=A0ABU8DTI2_9ACTN
MSTPAVTVGPATPATYAAELLAVHGFAVLPVVDAADHLLGVVSEADLVRDRIRPDPRLHARRDTVGRGASGDRAPASLVAGIMTAPATAVDGSADAADAARLLLDGGHRSVPVLEHDRVVGVLARRDLLSTLLRSDEDVRAELLALVEHYTGQLGAVDVTVRDGCAELVRVHGAPDPDEERESAALTTLAHTVPGVVDVVVRDGAVDEGRAGGDAG